MLETLLEEQLPGGAFPSSVRCGDCIFQDGNAFVTALVLYELMRGHGHPRVDAAAARALDFLERCEVQRAMFSFYPPGEHPPWMPQLPPDADDTALIAVALVRGGRRDESFLAEAARALAPFRRNWFAGNGKPWLRPGAFATWLSERYFPNNVDLCVNVNAGVLVAKAGLAEEMKLDAIAEMVTEGIAWAGQSEPRALLLSPYYPRATELRDAIDRAVEQGVDAFRPAQQLLGECEWAREDAVPWPDERPVCGSFDRRVLWTAPVLQRARRWPKMTHQRPS